MSLAEAVATLFGLGRLRPGSGTWASLAAALLAWPIAAYGGRFVLLCAALAAWLIGIWAADAYARATAMEDPSECVVDELAGQWLACAFAPVTLPAFAAAFVLFRLFDVWKPWPIARLEHLPGGMGIMADDIAAGLAAAAIVAVLAHAGLV